jgi:hypothetical protein
MMKRKKKMTPEQQQQMDLVQKGLDTIDLEKYTQKVEAALRLKKDPLNSSQVLIVLLNVSVGIFEETLKKDPSSVQKKEIERMRDECNAIVINLAYSLGVHNDSRSVPRLTEKP